MARVKLLRFVNEGGLDVWLPATEGLCEWRRVVHARRFIVQDGQPTITVEEDILGTPKLFIIRGLGPRGDNAVCLPVVRREDGTLEADTSQGAAGSVKSCRKLPAGYWTFIRPLQAGDPEIPGA